MVRILTLDDDYETGNLIGLILEHAGYELMTTTDSYEAWALLHTVPVALFLQDRNRPCVNGQDFYRLMRTDERLNDVAVIMVTSSAQEKHRTAALNAGMDGYITKPFGAQELLTAVRDVLLRRGKSVPQEIEWHETSLEQCRAALHDANSQTRRTALLVWGWRRTKWPIKPPIQALGDTDGTVRLAAVKALRRLQDPRAVQPLVGLLNDRQIEVRLGAIQTLGLLEDLQAVEPLVELLSDADEATGWAAALALGRLKAVQAVEPLIAALNDERSLVRMMAALSLGRIEDDRATAPLTETLADDDAWVCQAAAVALGQIGDPQAIEYLLQALHNPAALVCEKAAYALARIGGPAVEPLIERLQHLEVRVRRAVASVLWFARDDELVVKSLIAALQDEDREVRLIAARTLGSSGDPQAIEPLITVLQDNDADVVWEAIYALGRLGNTQALPALERVAQEDSRSTEHGAAVADAAWKAIEMIQGASAREL